MFPASAFRKRLLLPLVQPSTLQALVHIMDQLGYERFVLYSTDLGCTVGLHIVNAYQERILNHITAFYVAIPNSTDQARHAAGETTPDESRYRVSYNAFIANHSAYASPHSTFRLSVAYALNDSPLGFLAWMWQSTRTVSDKP